MRVGVFVSVCLRNKSSFIIVTVIHEASFCKDVLTIPRCQLPPFLFSSVLLLAQLSQQHFVHSFILSRCNPDQQANEELVCAHTQTHTKFILNI